MANYAGEYVAYQYTQRERAENLISTITNEFLEAIIAVAPRGSGLALRYQQIAGDLSIEAEHDVRRMCAPFILIFWIHCKTRRESTTLFRPVGY
ncbi:MAG: hypothetical protein R2932_44895 [Caldilineaceae bacterium]